MSIDPVWSGVAELSRAFQARTLSPVDVVDALLARIEKRDPVLHSYIAVYAADARLAGVRDNAATLQRLACFRRKGEPTHSG